MAALILYEQIYEMLEQHLDPKVPQATRERLAFLVLGLLHGKEISPARLAHALATLGLNQASPESWERRIRRCENDPYLTTTLCLHPLIQHYLAIGAPNPLLLILDPTTKNDAITLVAITIPYRGRSLPLAWMTWPGNQPLEGEGMWERIKTLLQEIAPLLPKGVEVVMLADGAFGCPCFIDRVRELGWHVLVRAQGQTHCRDRQGVERQIGSLVWRVGQRAKGRYEVFKKEGWRPLSVFVFGRLRRGKDGEKRLEALCLVSDLPAKMAVAHLYTKRYQIESGFRDYKSHGWQWESSQVSDLAHWKRLLLVMALGSWIVLMAGTQVAAEALDKARQSCRLWPPYESKYSLFRLGLELLDRLIVTWRNLPMQWQLCDWDAPVWKKQITGASLHKYLFSDCPKRPRTDR